MVQISYILYESWRYKKKRTLMFQTLTVSNFEQAILMWKWRSIHGIAPVFPAFGWPSSLRMTFQTQVDPCLHPLALQWYIDYEPVKSMKHRSKPRACKTWKPGGKYGRFTFKQPFSDWQVCLTARQPGSFLPLSDVLLAAVPSLHWLNKDTVHVKYGGVALGRCIRNKIWKIYSHLYKDLHLPKFPAIW